MIGFIGAGKMAEVFIVSLIDSELAGPSDIIASEINPERRADIAARLGVSVTDNGGDVARAAETIILAVKPQGVGEVLDELTDHIGEGHLVISIAAGVRIASLEERLPAARIIRVMPNMASQVGQGMSVYCLGPRTRREDAETVTALLNCSGRSRAMQEDHLDAVTAVSGSGPAFFAHLLELIADAGAAEGLNRADAMELATQTMRGTATMIQHTGVTPEALITAIKTPGGTTAAGLEKLQVPITATILEATIHAAAERSRKLGG